MTYDLHTNLACSTVAVAPVPALSGTTVSVQAGHGAYFPGGTFWLLACPANTTPTRATGELLRATRSGDVLTVVRAQGGTTAKAIAVGWVLAEVVTAGTLQAVEQRTMMPVAAKTADYVASAGDLVPVDASAGAVLVTLPSSGQVTVTKVDASANIVTVRGTDAMAGGSTEVWLTAQDSHVVASYDDTAHLWVPVGTHTRPTIRLTATGTITPTIELIAGSTASVSWIVDGVTTVTGASPTIALGAGTHQVVLRVTDGAGVDAYDQVKTVNFGYDHTQDTGHYGPTIVGGLQAANSDYDHAATTGITAISGVALLRNLRNFLAAGSGLACALDFTGLTSLEFIECYGAHITGVTLTGCTSLIRLCVEACNLTSLDLNPVAGNLYDLRSAVQQGGALAFTALTANMVHLYHWCTRDQTITGFPAWSRLPVLEELYVWNCELSGSLSPVSSALRSVLAYDNAWTTVDLTNQIPAGASGILWLQTCPSLTSVTLAGCAGIGNINLSGCTALDQSDIDGVLDTVESWNTSNGTLNLSGTTAPSASGSADATTLTGRGWTVTTVATAWGDTFDRADTLGGLTDVGHGWVGVGSPVANIVSNALVNQSVGGSYRVIANPANSGLDADSTVTIVCPHSITAQSFWGIVLGYRTDTHTGVRVLVTTGTTVIMGNATGPFDGGVSVTTDDGFPASWAVNQDHTISVHRSGTTVTLEIDGQTVCHGTVDINTGVDGLAVGICGDNTVTLNSITTSTP